MIIKNAGQTITVRNDKVFNALGVSAFGRGIDGDVTLSASKNINTERIGAGLSRTVDAPVAEVTGISGVTLAITMQAGAVEDFFADDICLVINLQGDTTNYG